MAILDFDTIYRPGLLCFEDPFDIEEEADFEENSQASGKLNHIDSFNLAHDDLDFYGNYDAATLLPSLLFDEGNPDQLVPSSPHYPSTSTRFDFSSETDSHFAFHSAIDPNYNSQADENYGDYSEVPNLTAPTSAHPSTNNSENLADDTNVPTPTPYHALEESSQCSTSSQESSASSCISYLLYDLNHLSQSSSSSSDEDRRELDSCAPDFHVVPSSTIEE